MLALVSTLVSLLAVHVGQPVTRPVAGEKRFAPNAVGIRWRRPADDCFKLLGFDRTGALLAVSGSHGIAILSARDGHKVSNIATDPRGICGFVPTGNGFSWFEERFEANSSVTLVTWNGRTLSRIKLCDKQRKEIIRSTSISDQGTDCFVKTDLRSFLFHLGKASVVTTLLPKDMSYLAFGKTSRLALFPSGSLPKAQPGYHAVDFDAREQAVACVLLCEATGELVIPSGAHEYPFLELIDLTDGTKRHVSVGNDDPFYRSVSSSSPVVAFGGYDLPIMGYTNEMSWIEVSKLAPEPQSSEFRFDKDMPTSFALTPDGNGMATRSNKTIELVDLNWQK